MNYDEGADANDEVNLSHTSHDQLPSVEANLESSSFHHSLTVATYATEVVPAVYWTIRDITEYFHGLKMDTSANRISIMSRAQYGHHCRKFGLT